MTRQARILVPGDPSAVAFARDRVLTYVRAWGVRLDEELGDAVKLVASELITNAVVHGEGLATVGLYLGDGRLLLVVDDAGPAEPQRQYAADDDEQGRGLALVDFLSARNGWEPTTRGKRAWAEFEIPTPTRAALGEVPQRRVRATVPRADVNAMPSSSAAADSPIEYEREHR